MPEYLGSKIQLDGQPNYSSNKVRMYASREEKVAAPDKDNIPAQHPYAHGLLELQQGVPDLAVFLAQDPSSPYMTALMTTTHKALFTDAFLAQFVDSDGGFAFGGLRDTINELVAIAYHGVYLCQIHYNSENSDHRQVLNRFVP